MILKWVQSIVFDGETHFEGHFIMIIRLFGSIAKELMLVPTILSKRWVLEQMFVVSTHFGIFLTGNRRIFGSQSYKGASGTHLGLENNDKYKNV